MHFGYLQDDWRVAPKLTLNLGAALRVRHAAVGRRQLPDQLRSGDQHAAAGDATARSTTARSSTPIATTSRRASASPTASTRRRCIRAAYGIELRPLQPAGRREPAVVQRPARRADRHHAAAVAGALRGQPGADDLLPPDAGGLSGGPERAGELQPDQRPRQLHPARHEHRQHPELARHGAARAAGEPASSTSPTSATAAGNLMILGDFNQARPNAAGENTPLQARRPIQGYQFIQAAFDGGKGDYRALQVKVERRYSAASTCSTRSPGRGRATTRRATSRRPTATTAASTSPTSRASSACRATTSRSTTRRRWCGSCRSARDRRWGDDMHAGGRGHRSAAGG